jgi:cytochrome c6
MQKNKVVCNFLILPFFFFLAVQTVDGVTFEIGSELFKNNCIVCHLGGNNIIIPEKNLKRESLNENGMNNINAISYQILNGKNGMPAFSGRLKENEIEAIAKYVLDQSSKNFNNKIEEK